LVRWFMGISHTGHSAAFFNSPARSFKKLSNCLSIWNPQVDTTVSDQIDSDKLSTLKTFLGGTGREARQKFWFRSILKTARAFVRPPQGGGRKRVPTCVSTAGKTPSRRRGQAPQATVRPSERSERKKILSFELFKPMSRCTDTPMHRYTDKPISRCTDTVSHPICFVALSERSERKNFFFENKCRG
jgi:hypothetical protein